MEGGFSFCGVDISTIGLTYVPETSTMYDPINGADFDVSSYTDGTMDGGYYYGTVLKPKSFTLRCIFENQDIRTGIMNKVQNLFRRGRTGRLVFKNRDWVWYIATVTDVVNTNKLTNYMNGFLTVKLTAFYPFGRCDTLSFPQESSLSQWINNYSYSNNTYRYMKANTGFISEDKMPVIPSSSSEFGDSTDILVYNPGSEKAKCAIQVKGTSLKDGIVITNNTTNQVCKLSGFNSTNSLIVDSLNGKVVEYNSNTGESTMAFLYHYGGFIDLAPSSTVERDVSITKVKKKNGTVLYVPSNITPDETYIGKWIVYPNAHLKITAIQSGSFVCADTEAMTIGSIYSVDIVDCINEINITKNVSGTDLDNVSFTYKATFR